MRVGGPASECVKQNSCCEAGSPRSVWCRPVGFGCVWHQQASTPFADCLSCDQQPCRRQQYATDWPPHRLQRWATHRLRFLVIVHKIRARGGPADCPRSSIIGPCSLLCERQRLVQWMTAQFGGRGTSQGDPAGHTCSLEGPEPEPRATIGVSDLSSPAAGSRPVGCKEVERNLMGEGKFLGRSTDAPPPRSLPHSSVVRRAALLLCRRCRGLLVVGNRLLVCQG